MKLVGRVPVEPLGDERMTNIERAIVAGAADAAARGRARESRWPVLGFALATLVLVAGAGFLGWRMRGGAAPSGGGVEVAPLAVTSEGPTTIDIGDARITSDPATAYVVTRPGTGVRVTMSKGKVGLEVGKRGHRDPLIVQAGDTEVIVVGTAFTVDYDGLGDVDVRVTEGVVKVKRAQQEDRVAAGEAWQTTRGTIALALADSRPRTQVAGDPAIDRRAPVASTGSDPLVIPVEPGKDIGLHDRTAKVPEARIPTTGVMQGGGDRSHGKPEHVRPTAPPLTPHASLYKDAMSRLAAMPVAPAVDVGPVHASKAIAILRERSLKTGAQASAAMYSIAVLQHYKLGRNGEAISTLEAYVRRFRGGAEYKAALWLRVRIKCLQRVDDHCRQAAFTYAHEDPGSEAGRLASTLSTMTSE